MFLCYVGRFSEFIFIKETNLNLYHLPAHHNESLHYPDELHLISHVHYMLSNATMKAIQLSIDTVPAILNSINIKNGRKTQSAQLARM